MKSFAKVLKYEGLLLSFIALVVLLLATDMFIRFWYVLAVGPVALIAGLALDLGSVTATLRRRTARFGANAIVFTIVVTAILVFLNVMAKGWDKTWDGTSAGVNTLSEQTVKILQNLDAPVQVTAFFESAEAKNLENVLKRYRDAAKPEMFVYRIVDPDRDPQLAQRYNIQRRGAIVVEQQGSQNIIGEQTEQALTQSILKVTQAKGGPICFVSGHGEASLADNENNGAALFKRLLENENHDVKEIVLAGRAVPEDCAVVVIAGPDRAYGDIEVKTVTDWAQKGGRLLLMADANTTTGFEAWLESLSVKLNNDAVVEPFVNPFYGSQLGVTPVVQDYPPHEITKDLKQPTIFSLARSLTLNTNANAPAMVSALLKTTAEAWGETDISALLNDGKVEKSDADTPGPLVLGAAVEMAPGAQPEPPEVDEPEAEKTPQDGGRMLVFGDSNWIRNELIAQLYNSNLALNSVAWLAGKDEIISIRPNTYDAAPVFLTPADRDAVFFVSVFSVPLLVAMFGIGVFIARGRRSDA